MAEATLLNRSSSDSFDNIDKNSKLCQQPEAQLKHSAKEFLYAK